MASVSNANVKDLYVEVERRFKALRVNNDKLDVSVQKLHAEVYTQACKLDANVELRSASLDEPVSGDSGYGFKDDQTFVSTRVLVDGPVEQRLVGKRTEANKSFRDLLEKVGDETKRSQQLADHYEQLNLLKSSLDLVEEGESYVGKFLLTRADDSE